MTAVGVDRGANQEKMAMTTYNDVLNYLDLITDSVGDNVDASPHGRWWKKPAQDAHGNPIPGQVVPLSLAEFKAGTVTGTGITPPVPIIDPGADKTQSSFYQILLGKLTVGTKIYPQMPFRGPYITDSAFDSGTGAATDTTPGSIVYTLSNGVTTITGKEINDAIKQWLAAGAL